MKKLVCLIVAMILCLSCVALASAAPSKATSDMTSTTTTTQSETVTKPIDTTGFVLFLVTDDMVEYQDRIDIAKAEIEKLNAAQPIEAYFGEPVDEEGNTVDLKAKLGAEAVNVFEFYPVVASGYSEEFGDVTAKLLFSTPYEKDLAVAVMVGFVTVNEDGTQTVAWHALNGVGVESDAVEAQGAIEVVFDSKTVLAIQEGIALLAVVSK